ncbi:MAG: ParB/RepB/Spo0J family partition protein, partial [Terracidiphilus sp.]
MQTVATSTIPQEVPLSALVPSPTNPRQHFDEDKLNELAETIRKSGVYQAILARPKDNTLEIVFGERRYRASLIAGKETIPALIREMNDAEVLEAQLIELSVVVKSFLSAFAIPHVVDISTTCMCPIYKGHSIQKETI